MARKRKAAPTMEEINARKKKAPPSYEKSFASHEKAACWDEAKNGNVKPRDVFKSTADIYHFICDNEECNHSFPTSLHMAASLGSWCPYCSSPPQKMCNSSIDCKPCYAKSFASHEKAKFWDHDNNENVKPRDVFKSSPNHKYNFICDTCNHPFPASLNNVSAGRWCPNCRNKTELKLYEALLPHFPCLKRQFKAKWCMSTKKNKKSFLPFDFALSLKIIIEVHGPQHFVQVRNWKAPELTHENDLYKLKCANENGFSVITLLQDDVWNDKYAWLSELLTAIAECREAQAQAAQAQVAAVPHNKFLCKNNEFADYLFLQ